MGERERRGAPPYGGTFVSRAVVMDADQIRRAIKRMAHEILESNRGLDDVVIIGLQTGGIEPALHLVEALETIEGSRPPLGSVDVAFHRDDIGLRPVLPEAPTDINVDLHGCTVILVDDVLFTGRTVRAALDALNDFGRPRSVQLAVMVDRGHRELPIRADFVGKNLPTARSEAVRVTMSAVEIGSMQK